jgi:3-oxoacyl-[acyl-carrier-protein] synthase-3
VDTHRHYAQHQVSKAQSERFGEILGLDLDRVYKLYPKFGNIGPAGIAIVLSRLGKEGLASPGDRIAMMGIGSGINCSMAELMW